jgi:hypothetical protein
MGRRMESLGRQRERSHDKEQPITKPTAEMIKKSEAASF